MRTRCRWRRTGLRRKGEHDAQDQVGEGGRHKCFHGTSAPEHPVGHKFCGHDEIKGREDPQELFSGEQSFGGGGIHEQQEQVLSQEYVQEDDGHADAPDQPESGAQAAFDPVGDAGADVLCREV